MTDDRELQKIIKEKEKKTKKLIKAKTKVFKLESELNSQKNILIHGQMDRDIDNILNNPITEAPDYDFKQGFLALMPNIYDIEKGFIDKLCDEICAIANLGRDRYGFIFMGITDKEEDTVRIEQLYQLPSVERRNGFGIVGIDREAIRRKEKFDQYSLYITRLLQKNLESTFANTILSKITYRTINSKIIFIFRIICGDMLVHHNKKYYIRRGSEKAQLLSTEEVLHYYMENFK